MTLHESPRRFALLAAAVAAAAAFCFAASGERVDAAVSGSSAARSAGPHSGVPVLVELFTSEGCSSCPPADALLASLDRTQPVPGADIIVLEEHVDYWDSLGWKDRFSSAAFTDRQKEYGNSFRLGDIYTPQMVVDGVRQLNGADSGAAKKAIQEQATLAHSALLHFSTVSVSEDRVGFTLAVGGVPTEPFDLYATLVEPQETTEVRAGENGGRTLHHAGVARSFSRVGGAVRASELEGRSFEFSANLPGRSSRKDSPGAGLDGMRLVVFAQTKHTGPVLGIASCTFTASPAGPQSSARANRCPIPSI